MRFKSIGLALQLEVNLSFLLCFTLKFFKYKLPGGGGAYIWSGVLMGGFLRYRFGVPIFGGAYFRNFTVYTYV